MYSRQDIIEIFSTFMQLEDNGCWDWTTDPRLRRSMSNCLEQTPDAPTSDSFWAIYWHKFWLSAFDRVAEAHLSAYLQETCYWASKKMLSYCSGPRYQLTDCFQIAIAVIPKILKGYNSQRASSLKDYANVAFRSTLRDALRSSQEADICTDWALLRKLSKKRLEEALFRAGFAPETIERYHLAWMCFKALYAPTPATGTRRLSKPDSQLWDAIAQRYNRDRLLHLNSPGLESSPQDIEGWLLECARLARHYLYPFRTSLNECKPGSEGREPIEEIPAAVNLTLLEQAIDRERDEERQQQRQQLEAVLETAIFALNPQSQDLVKLYYRHNLTQKQIAARLDIKQYQVSRKLARARETLLKTLARWSQTTRNVALTSEQLQEASELLEEWLWGYYSKPPSTETAKFSRRVGADEEISPSPTSK
ncbi:MAG: sigma-70 family RNA polymerase sigma factor [Cyanobacteriota bacterium]|nr:sigma-70 family RNA polymerase sigma factor [Cyanobacteriota bacterium]